MCSQHGISLQLSCKPAERLPPRAGHGAALIGTTLLICGGRNFADKNMLNYDSFHLLNLGTSDLLISCPTSADHSFVLQYRESGPA
jgi:hypothetical protein